MLLEGHFIPKNFRTPLAIEAHHITLKSLALVRPKLRNSLSTNQIARFVNYYCYDVNVIEFSIRLTN